MVKERKLVKNEGYFLLIIAAVIVAAIFAVGFFITYFFIKKSILCGIAGGYALMVIIVFIWYSIEEIVY